MRTRIFFRVLAYAFPGLELITEIERMLMICMEAINSAFYKTKWYHLK